MKRINRLFLIFLALCMLTSCFFGCAREKDSSIATDTTDNITDIGEFELTLESLADYVIVIPSVSEENMSSAAQALQRIIEKCIGKAPDIVTDDQVFECEILLGPTDREETHNVYSSVRHYDTGYALVGKKILIIGRTNDTVRESALLFKTDVLDVNPVSGVLMSDNDKKIISNKELNDEYEWYEQSRAEYYSPILEGVTINAIGDSYFN